MSRKGHAVEGVREVVLMRGAGYRVGAEERGEEGEVDQKGGRALGHSMRRILVGKSKTDRLICP